jgi:peptide/nickel transport system permease protein
MEFLKFLASRLFTYVLVIWTGITIVFFVPRFVPGNPVETMLARLMSQGQTMDPLLVQKMRETLTQMFGLEGTLWEQYSSFLRRVILTQDFGPSLSYYPTPVSDLVARSLHWSLALR